MDSSKTAFVLLPGAFCPASFYDQVIKLLKPPPNSIPSSNITAITLPSTRSAATLFDDAKHVASAITQLVDRNLDVVVAASSYGGFPATESFKYGSQTKADRSQQGLEGGVIALVYIAAFLPQVGESLNILNPGAFPGTEPIIDIALLKSPEFAAALFGDVSQELAGNYFDQLLTQSRQSLEDQLTYPGWEDVKVYYLHTKKDQIIKPELQMEMIEKFRKKGEKVEVIETEFSHLPMLDREKEVVDVLVMAGKAA